MEKMEVKIYPDPILSKECAEVAVGDMDAVNILEKMFPLLYKYEAGGFAAPQFGILKRLVVIDTRERSEHSATKLKMINPRVIWRSENMVESLEGCISIPVLRETVIRHESVSVEYLNERFEKCIIEKATEYLAMCLQHEIDHLDGKLYIDKLSRLKRARAVRKFQKSQEEGIKVEK
jgi:peptide deformylase